MKAKKTVATTTPSSYRSKQCLTPKPTNKKPNGKPARTPKRGK